MNTNDDINNKKSDKYYKYYETEEYKKNYAEHQIRLAQGLIDMRLENSMGTQTEIIPKPTYKELEKEPFLARITAQLETNNHDGYCSDEDCKYTRKIVKAVIIVPEQYRTQSVGLIANTREYKWANHLLLPEVNVQGSGYCRFVKPKGGLGQHKYRYTIKKVEIVKNKKYKSISEPETNRKRYLVMTTEGSYSIEIYEPYGYSDTKKGAQKMADDAVCYGIKGDNNNHIIFSSAHIYDLDNMKYIGSDNVLSEEFEYYLERRRPVTSYWDKDKGALVNYTKQELAARLNKLYNKMVDKLEGLPDISK